MTTKPRQQPISDKSADQTTEQIANQSKAPALHDAASQPSGDDSDQKNN
jgi:hypothetical protein